MRYEREQGLPTADLGKVERDIAPSADLEPFPKDHPFTVGDVRKYAYAKRYGAGVSAEFAQHLAACSTCAPFLELLEGTDPLLIPRDKDEQVDVLIKTAQDPKAQVELEKTFAAAIARATDKNGGVATAVSIFDSVSDKEKKIA